MVFLLQPANTDIILVMKAAPRLVINNKPLTPNIVRTVTAFSALTLLVGRQEGAGKTEWWGAGMVICLQ